MTRVFLDTVGAIALLNLTDQWHAAAIAAHESLLGEQSEFVATTYVLLETGNALSRTPLRRAAWLFEQELALAQGLVTPTASDWASAWSNYGQGHPGGPSIVDCVSFEVMRRLGLTEAFTNDRHFAEAGFRTLF